jgi:hypothetical protein
VAGSFDDQPAVAFPISGVGKKANYTLVERGHEHHESDTPIKNLLGHGMGLGILGDSNEEDDDAEFTGGWATYFTQNQIAGLCSFLFCVIWRKIRMSTEHSTHLT